VLDIERCLLQSESMNALLDEFRRQVHERALSVYDPETERGLLRFVMMREGGAPARPWSTSSAPPPTSRRWHPWPTRCGARAGRSASFLNVNAKKASVAVGSEEHLLLGRDHIRETLAR